MQIEMSIKGLMVDPITNSPIVILLLEDDPNDAGLVEERLRADHFIPRITRVQDRTEFLRALKDGEFDEKLVKAQYFSTNRFSAH